MFNVDYSTGAIEMNVGDTGSFQIAATRSDDEPWTGDDVATFTVNLDPKDTFMWRDGSCYVGVCPDKGTWLLAPGDVVELLDFKFSLR